MIKKKFDNFLLLLLLCYFICTICSKVSFSATFPTDIPPYINYQGTLTRLSDDVGVNERLTMNFSIYSVPEGGEAIYVQTKVVAVNNGQFGIVLGKGEGWYGEEKIEDGIPVEVFEENNQIYIAIQIEGHPEMYPRQKLISVSYAYKAEMAKKAREADSAITAKTAENVMGQINVDVSGNVGIGTATPRDKLDIVANGTNSILRLDTGLDPNHFTQIRLDAARLNEGQSVGGMIFFNNGPTPVAQLDATKGSSDIKGNLAFYTSDIERLRIDENGNVGIGITSPGEKLEVSGNIKAEGGIYAKKLEVHGKTKSIANGTEYFMVPKGTIVMWSGTINSIPQDWALCDGNNGTPDLRERFVMGAASGNNPGTSGGASSYTLTVDQLPSHTHTGSSSAAGNHSHSGSTSTNGEHKHAIHLGNGDPRTPSVNVLQRYPNSELGDGQDFDVCYGSGNHSHSISTNSAGSHAHSFITDATGSDAPVDNRPSYYALAFIMKI